MGPEDVHPGADRFPRPSGVRDQPVRHQEQVRPRGGRLRLCTGMIRVCLEGMHETVVVDLCALAEAWGVPA